MHYLLNHERNVILTQTAPHSSVRCVTNWLHVAIVESCYSKLIIFPKWNQPCMHIM